MSKPTTLPDLGHRWQAAPLEPGQLVPSRWGCPDCLLSGPTPYDTLCPDRVLAWGREQYEAGRAAERAAIRARIRRAAVAAEKAANTMQGTPNAIAVQSGVASGLQDAVAIIDNMGADHAP